MLEFLQTYSEKREKAEEEKTKLLREMKEEKQAFFNRFCQYMEKKWEVQAARLYWMR